MRESIMIIERCVTEDLTGKIEDETKQTKKTSGVVSIQLSDAGIIVPH